MMLSRCTVLNNKSVQVLSVIRNVTIPNAPILESHVQGKVKWYDSVKGYGVIERNDNKQDVFVHLTSIKGKNPQHLTRTLAEGETVEFDVVQGRLGLEAVKVTGPGGTNVQGSALGVFYRRQISAGTNFYGTSFAAQNYYPGGPPPSAFNGIAAGVGVPRPTGPVFPAPGGFALPAPVPAGFAGPAFGVGGYAGYRGPTPIGFGSRMF